MKHNIYLCQVNKNYGSNAFLPYSVGLIQAYCQTIPEINENFDFKGFIFLRDEPRKVAESLERPEIVGISCYIWNWEWSMAFARSVKARYPDCLVILGGPQVPVGSENFFIEHSYVDLLAHYEGEITFSEVLLEYLKEPRDFTRVPGLSVRIDGNRCYKTPVRERIKDLSEIPSPYLAGLFDSLTKLPYSWNVSQETNRGCPYSCTFCDWGSSVYQKVRAFDDDRLLQEFEWAGKNHAELLYNCDANYGILPRDLMLTEKLVETKKKYGFPRQFRAAFAKNSNEKVFNLSKMLNEAKMDKGVTLSFQSMNTNTLQLVKRVNIRITDFANLMNLYHKANIPTYTELILGLPGETYDTFADGIDELLRAGQHEGLNIYMCQILPNSEMGQPEYIKMHGIRSFRTPSLWLHATPSADEITEYTDYIVETNTLSLVDWKRSYLLSWVVQAFHCLPLTQCLAIFFFFKFGITYRTFYERLLKFAEKNTGTLIGKELFFVNDMMEKALHGGPWQAVMPKFGNITWPTEELSFLKMVCEKETFYNEMRVFLNQLEEEFKLGPAKEILDDLIVWQSNMVVDPYAPKSFPLSLRFNLHEYFQNAYLGKAIELFKGEYPLTVIPKTEYGGDLEKFSREVVWYGRKGGRFLHPIIVNTET